MTTRTIRMVLDLSVEQNADNDDVAQGIFEYVANIGPSADVPGLFSVDGWDPEGGFWDSPRPRRN